MQNCRYISNDTGLGGPDYLNVYEDREYVGINDGLDLLSIARCDVGDSPARLRRNFYITFTNIV